MKHLATSFLGLRGFIQTGDGRETEKFNNLSFSKKSSSREIAIRGNREGTRLLLKVFEKICEIRLSKVQKFESPNVQKFRHAHRSKYPPFAKNSVTIRVPRSNG